VLKRLVRGEKKVKFFFKKAWRLKKDAYLCHPETREIATLDEGNKK
jgi:hypothetical protein